MTGNAQNKLGQLFVDIGIGNVGKVLKGLNSVSASFLLTKNAAAQAIKPFVNIGKQALNSAVGIGKMAAALGTTKVNAQKLSYYLKQYKSEGLENSVANIQDIFNRLKTGYGGLDGQMAMSMGQLGLDWQKYNGTFEDTLQYIQDVKNALKNGNWTEVDKIKHLTNLGLGEWKYIFEKPDFDIRKSLGIDEKEIEKEIRAEEAMERLKIALEQLTQKLTVTLLDKGILDKAEKLIDKLDVWVSNGAEFSDKAKNTANNVARIGGAAAIGRIIGGAPGAAIATVAAFGAIQYEKNANSIGGKMTPLAFGGGAINPNVNPFKVQPVHVTTQINTRDPETTAKTNIKNGESERLEAANRNQAQR